MACALWYVCMASFWDAINLVLVLGIVSGFADGWPACYFLLCLECGNFHVPFILSVVIWMVWVGLWFHIFIRRFVMDCLLPLFGFHSLIGYRLFLRLEIRNIGDIFWISCIGRKFLEFWRFQFGWFEILIMFDELFNCHFSSILSSGKFLVISVAVYFFWSLMRFCWIISRHFLA